jgi:hypothetical protein
MIKTVRMRIIRLVFSLGSYCVTYGDSIIEGQRGGVKAFFCNIIGEQGPF